MFYRSDDPTNSLKVLKEASNLIGRKAETELRACHATGMAPLARRRSFFNRPRRLLVKNNEMFELRSKYKLQNELAT